MSLWLEGGGGEGRTMLVVAGAGVDRQRRSQPVALVVGMNRGKNN